MNKVKRKRIWNYILHLLFLSFISGAIMWEGTQYSPRNGLLSLVHGLTPGITMLILIVYGVNLGLRKRTIAKKQQLIRRMNVVMLIWFITTTFIWILSS